MEKGGIPKLLITFFGIGLLGAQFPGAINLYVQAFYITEIAKLPVSSYTIITTASMIINSIASPFISIIIEKGKAGRWGKTRKWLILGPLLGIVPYTLAYSRIGNQVTAILIIAVGYTLFFMFKSLAVVAQIKMIPSIATTPDERALLSGRRAFWINVGNMTFSVFSTALIDFCIKFFGGKTLGYTALAAISATIMFLFYGFEFFLTKGYDETEIGTYDLVEHMPVSIGYKDILKNIINNPPLKIA